MSLGRRLVAWFVATAAALAAAAAYAQSLPPGADACLARIEQLRAAGAAVADQPNAAPAAVPLLGNVCPDFAATLAQSPWGDALVGASPDELPTRSFVLLTKLVAGYGRPTANRQELRTTELDDVLAELKLDEPTVAPTLWERVRMWLDEHVGGGNDVTPEWLAKWLKQLSPSERGVRYLVAALGILLVLATAAIVLNELRVTGLFGRGVLRKYSPLGPSAPEPGETSARDWHDVVRAPLARRPALLLAIVLETLRKRGRAPRDSLTHRELLRATTGLDAEQGAAFEAIVRAAERITFGDWRPVEHELDGVLARGRALLASFAKDQPKSR